ncbi:MAG: fumarate hydratase [Candidatus Omnitrophota bacterium]
MTARRVKAKHIENIVRDLCIQANTVLRPDVLKALVEVHRKAQKASLEEKMLGVLLDNAALARDKGVPLCQDTGMLIVFVEIGEEVLVCDGSLKDAINKGVEAAYREGCFRKSVVGDPLTRKNTGTNTPAVIHADIVSGDKITVSVMPKGFGSENKSRLNMLLPTCGPDEITDFCVKAVKAAGPDACPPYILGIGLGGTMDSCALLAKKALLRPIDRPNPAPHIAELEERIKKEANALEVGVMGLGGAATVIGVNIDEAPTHIAGLPVVINISCHALRSACAVI